MSNARKKLSSSIIIESNEDFNLFKKWFKKM